MTLLPSFVNLIEHGSWKISSIVIWKWKKMDDSFQLCLLMVNFVQLKPHNAWFLKLSQRKHLIQFDLSYLHHTLKLKYMWYAWIRKQEIFDNISSGQKWTKDVKMRKRKLTKDGWFSFFTFLRGSQQKKFWKDVVNISSELLKFRYAWRGYILGGNVGIFICY